MGSSISGIGARPLATQGQAEAGTDNGAVMTPLRTAQAIAALGGGGGGADYILIRYQVASGSFGGGITSGSWQVRPLNTETFDTGNHASVASNQITLAAGTYEVKAYGAIYLADTHHKIRLYDTTGTATLVLGMSCYLTSGGAGVDLAYLSGRFTLSTSSVLELHHWASNSQVDYGMGVPNSFGSEPEIYSSVELWKVG